MPFTSIHVWKQTHDKANGLLHRALRNCALSFHGDMGGQNGEKLGSPAWNYGPKQCIMMWFIFHLLNFIQSVQLHAPAFPEREKQCSTDLGFDLHFIIG